MVVCAGVGAADDLVGRWVSWSYGEGVVGKEGEYHDCHVFIVDAVVVHRWLEEVRVLLEPGGVSCALLSCDIPRYPCCVVHFEYHWGSTLCSDGSRVRISLTTWAGSTGLGSLLLLCFSNYLSFGYSWLVFW